ncbi:hypothetical protein LSAT2_008285 [Lamellibrachia satsuma]|nr:hypothetical protein LSAT2_008285 [Lamellibrachia satsuma]
MNASGYFILTLLASTLMANWCTANPASTIAFKMCMALCKKTYYKCMMKRGCNESAARHLKRCKGSLAKCNNECAEPGRWDHL